MRDGQSNTDAEYHRWLANNPENFCFEQAIPRVAALQDAARFQIQDRSFQAKYPGEAGKAIKAVSAEILERMAAANLEKAAQQRAS
jgi:chromosome partitioning protein